LQYYKGKIILVTGGLGFIGSHLIDKLHEYSPEKIIIIDNRIAGTTMRYIQKYNDNVVKFYNLDIKNIFENPFRNERFDMIFHLAAQPDVLTSNKKPYSDFEENVIGSLNLLEYARLNDIKEFIFAASGGTMYGEPEKSPTNEEVRLKPISNYGAAKAAVEMYLSSYNHNYDIKTTSIRFGNVYGPRSNHGVMYDFYQKLLLDSKKLKILGNGKQKKSYLYIDDAVHGFTIAGSRNSNIFEAYNMAYPELITVDEIATLIIKEIYGEDNVSRQYTGGERGWDGDVKKIDLSIDKILKIGWEPRISIAEGIKNYIAWLKNQK
jgi:UDP-glucose 4-epimerase